MNANQEISTRDIYLRAYMDGYNAALKTVKETAEKPYIDREGLIKRYDGKIGDAKAYAILDAVRHYCNGGKLNTNKLVLRSELEYWENEVEKKYKERL